MLTESREPIRIIRDERALDILLAEAPATNGMRVVQKQGIQLDGDWFIAPELEGYIRQQVKVLYDPIDLGKIYVFGAEGFICIAESPRLSGISRQEVAIKAKERQKQRVQAARKALKQIAKTAKTDEIVEEILTQEQLAAAKLVPFPQPAEFHDTEALKAATDAVLAMESRKPQRQVSAKDYRKAVVDPNQVLEKVFRAWRKGLEVSTQDKNLASQHILLPEGEGIVIGIAEGLDEQKRFLAWLTEQHL